MASPVIRYTPRALPTDRAPCFLIARWSDAGEARYAFHDQIEIGRDDGRPAEPGTMLVADSAVSRRHCIVSRRPDGRCVIRDVSRNGTRIDGRRLVPNVEVELHPGQRISMNEGLDLVLESPPAQSPATPDEPEFDSATVSASALAYATLLVGDIRDYTVLVRQAPLAVLQQSVNRVLAILSEAVGDLGGTVKEYQGDALVAFWEGSVHGAQVAATACHAALELDRRVQRLAADRSVWQLEDFALSMDWALATGPVMINSFGGDQPGGLSMVGEPIVLAFRLEKFADAATGRILTCPVTRQMAGARFEFRDLGPMLAKGFSTPDLVFSLDRELSDRPAEAG